MSVVTVRTPSREVCHEGPGFPQSRPMNALARTSERRSERLLADLLESQGWDLRSPPRGELYLQTEYRADANLAEALKTASKSGDGLGIPEALLVDDDGNPLLVVETKASPESIDEAIGDAKGYGDALTAHGYHPLAVALAGTEADEFRLQVLKRSAAYWVPITYDGHPINWIPGKVDVRRLAVPGSTAEIRPTPPPDYVLAARANEINRFLREADIKDEYRPTHVAAIMLALWHSRGNIRRDPHYILRDVNAECRDALIEAGKANLAKSIRVDEANMKLRSNSIAIARILERLNVTVLTAEHDYLGQLYETFFRYTGGNTIGQYFTPRHITRMMVDICEASSSDVVLDIACGTGGFFVAFMDRLIKKEHLSRAAMVKVIQKQILGFESEPNTAALCAANMILRGDGSTQIQQSDSLTLRDFPIGKATIAVTNPPFPHKNTDTPVESFIERSLEGLRQDGRLAVIVPSSLLVKSHRGAWRERILSKNTLLAVCQLPDELFQPFASVTTSIVFLRKGRPHPVTRRTAFVRLQHDGLVLRKSARVRTGSEPDQVPLAMDSIVNNTEIPGFSSSTAVSGREEWSPGAYITSATEDEDKQKAAVDILLRRLASFYTRYAPEILAQRRAVENGEIEQKKYLDFVSSIKRTNAERRTGEDDEVGGRFDILYGLGDVESRADIPPGKTLVVSPTEQYNGCDGWYEFHTVLEPPFITVARTGSIGEAFVHIEPVAPNSDCLVLLPRRDEWASIPELILAASALRAERWRFNYGRKITPDRIVSVRVARSDGVATYTAELWAKFEEVIRASLSPYNDMNRSNRMAEKPKRKPYQKGLPADYQGATPEQVAKAVLRYRPEQPVRPSEKKADG